jgi:hypothetical protein
MHRGSVSTNFLVGNLYSPQRFCRRLRKNSQSRGLSAGRIPSTPLFSTPHPKGGCCLDPQENILSAGFDNTQTLKAAVAHYTRVGEFPTRRDRHTAFLVLPHLLHLGA